MTIKVAAAALGVLAIAGCSQEPPKADTAAIKQQILQQEARWNEAYKKRDGAALAAMYADDATLANANESLIRGKDAIQKTTAQFASDPNMRVTFAANRVEVAQSGELAYSRGQYMMTTSNPATNAPQTTNGYYLTVWKKQADGSWKALEDFTTPGPAPAVAERARMITSGF